MLLEKLVKVSLPLGRRDGQISVKSWNILHPFKPIVKSAALLIRLCSGHNAVPKGPEGSNPQKWAFMFIYVEEQSEDLVYAFDLLSQRSVCIPYFLLNSGEKPALSWCFVRSVTEVSPLACQTIPHSVLYLADETVGKSHHCKAELQKIFIDIRTVFTSKYAGDCIYIYHYYYY